MKLTILHQVFLRNPYICETIRLNLMALKQAGIVDYQYLIFNDRGSVEIKDDIKEVLPEIEYYYSDINYGLSMCRGGWIGGLNLVKGDIIHVTDQDDVMTALFYESSLKELSNPDIDFVFSNCYKAQSDLSLHPDTFGCHPHLPLDYSKPEECFKIWFGITEPESVVTKASNYVMGSGAMYKTKLHDIVGTPDIEFKGAYDFEYWARFLFHGIKGKYLGWPSWYYRLSDYSAGNAIVDGKPNRGHWQQLNVEAIKQKYTKLWNDRKLQGR